MLKTCREQRRTSLCDEKSGHISGSRHAAGILPCAANVKARVQIAYARLRRSATTKTETLGKQTCGENIACAANVKARVQVAYADCDARRRQKRTRSGSRHAAGIRPCAANVKRGAKKQKKGHKKRLRKPEVFFYLNFRNYLTILETTPEPTVLPPSRIAKRRPSSTATGLMSETSILTLSPGMTISTPSGSLMEPVTSVVRMKN